jgi:Retrotransposon gag protein
MQRTPPPGPLGHQQARHPSAAGQEGLDSPSRQQNVTPLAPSDQEPTLQTLLEAIQLLSTRMDNVVTRVDDLSTRVDNTQRQIQDLNALFVHRNSPPVRIERSQSPTTLRRPSPIRETRFGTAPPDLYGRPRRQYEREYTYAAPNLVRAGIVAPETQFEREASMPRGRQMSEVPAEIPPYRPSGDARTTAPTPKTCHKPQTYNGTPLENFSSWIWKMESFLHSTRTPADEYFSTAIFYLTGDADSFAYELVRQNNGQAPSWSAFKHSMRERFERSSARSDLLRRQLTRLKYQGISQMQDYCSQFRSLEQQIFNMSFEDRLCYFERRLPAECQYHIRLMDLSRGNMETVYEAAQRWAHVFGIRKAKDTHPVRPIRPFKMNSSEDIKPKVAQCFGCGKYGHVLHECLVTQNFHSEDNDKDTPYYSESATSAYESSNMHGDEYEDEYRDRESPTHNLMMSHQQHKNHSQVLRDGRGGERQRRRQR